MQVAPPPSKELTLSSNQSVKARLVSTEPQHSLIKPPPQLAHNSSESTETMTTMITMGAAAGRGPYPIPFHKMSSLPTVTLYCRGKNKGRKKKERRQECRLQMANKAKHLICLRVQGKQKSVLLRSDGYQMGATLHTPSAPVANAGGHGHKGLHLNWFQARN